MKLGDLVHTLGGELVAGSPGHEVKGVSSVARACAADLVFAEDAASVLQALASQAGVVVLMAAGGAVCPPGKCAVEVREPRLWFARAARLLAPPLPSSGVHPSAVLGARVELGKEVSIGPGVTIGENARIGAGSRIEAGAVIGAGVRIGAGCRIYPRVVLYPGTTLGDRVIVHAGAVLGADGFGYVRDPASGAYTQFPQQGTLLVEDDVEIGANSTIDRGALEETRIGRGVKIDNLVHVGHNCVIGEDVILVAQTGIGGSSTVGQGAVIGGQVGIADHVRIDAGVILGAQAGVPSNKRITLGGMKPGTVFWGTPARPIAQVLRELAALTRLAKGSRKAG
ncbi:MAG: UDP-3-O-(3-hydroxymyristoyl)glucosamine N-acyltransferase [Terracidiphilus sp.]